MKARKPKQKKADDPPDRPDYTSGIIVISTSDGKNIIVDKLLIDAYAARGNVLYENNGLTPSWESAGMVDRGKLFAQLGIGFIEKVEAYVKNTNLGGQENFGLTSIGSTSYPTANKGKETDGTGDWAPNELGMWKQTMTENGTIIQIVVYSRVGGKVKLGIYADSAGEPGALLSGPVEVTTSALSWTTATLTTPVYLLNGTSFWIASNRDTAGACRLGAGANLRNKAWAYGTAWPDPAGTTYSSYAYDFSAYVKYVKIKGFIKATKVVTTRTYTVQSISLYSHATGNARLAIFDNASPKAKLWESGSVALTASAWKTVNISDGTPTSLELAAGTYWLCWQYDNVLTAPSYTAGSSGDGFYKAYVYGAYPATITGETSSAEKWSEYGTGTWPPVAEDLVIGFSNRVDGPELFTKTISCPPDVVGAWRAVNVREWWWHDKCFPYVKSSGADVSVAYDAEGPFDEFIIGTGRQALNRRLWIRLTYYGLPAGYVPIGGTVNAIIIPNISSAASADSVATTAGIYKTLLDAYGAGQCQSIYVKSNNYTGALYIYCDEVQVGLFFSFQTLNAAGFSCATPQITLLSYNETDNIYAVLVSIPYSFLKHFKVQYLSSPSGSTIDYRIVYSKIS